MNRSAAAAVMPEMRKVWLLATIAAAALTLTAEPVSAAPVPRADRCEAVGVTPFDPARLSSGGSVVAFATSAQLVPGDTNGTLDVYVQDVRGGDPELISVRRANTPGFGRSTAPSISADGRYVAFESDTRRLAKGDDDSGITDVFVRDRVAKTTTLVSSTPKGRSGNRESSRPDISPDGSRVAFQSFANDLTAGDRNTVYDIYVRDLKRRTTTLASALPTGAVAANVGSVTPAISDNGLVVFDSSEAFGNAPTDIRSTIRDETAYAHAIVVRDLRTGKARIVSDAPDGTPNDGISYRPDISADGRYVSFESTATNLVGDDTNNTPGLRGIFEPDVFVRDLKTGRLRRASVSSTGAEANGDGSSGPSLANNGLVAFESGATNLAPKDRNGALDVFVNSPGARTSLASFGAGGRSPRSAGYLSFGSVSPSLSGGGRQVAFASSAPALTKRSGGPVVFGAFVRSLHPGGKLYGPFGIGCRHRTFVAPATTAGSTRGDARASAALAACVGAACVLARRRPRARIAAVVAVCLGTAGIAAPASAHHYAPIQPGGPMLLESDPNGGVASANFVFRDRRTKDLYIGTAAHVTRGLGVGTEVPLEGVGKAGRLVYSREGSNAFSRQDFALVKIDARHAKKVDPAVRTWGGPTGVADPQRLLPGTMTYQYGQGAIFRHTQPTRAKAGPLMRMVEDDWGWMGWYLLTNWSFGGDSGSPILTAGGEGLGVTITLAAPYGEPGWSMGPTLALIVQELRLVGFDIELVTAPWHGPAGDVTGTVEHCANMPVEDGPRNDGCVRPHTEP